MSILTAQPAGIVVFVWGGENPHHVKMVRRVDIDAVTIDDDDGDVKVVKIYTVQNRQTIVRVELPASQYEGGDSWQDRQERRDRRDANAQALMMSVIAEDADIVWNNRGWSRVPDRDKVPSK